LHSALLIPQKDSIAYGSLAHVMVQQWRNFLNGGFENEFGDGNTGYW